jgi:tetratricopeptide (TPR) repeat protein
MERAITYAQRALALAAALGHIGLQTNVHFRLGQAYYDAGDYPRAAEHFERNVVTLQGDRLAERVGTGGHIATGGPIAADSRVYLGRCLAERGAFTEGRAIAEDGLRLAETINHTHYLVAACYGVSVVYRRQGDVQRAIPVLERAMGLCQDWHLPLYVPLLATALGLAYALEGRVAAGLALVEHGMEQQAPRGRTQTQTVVVACLSEAYVLAGRLEEAHQRAAQAVELARQYQQRGNQAWALWLLGESAARQASPEAEPATGHYRQALALAEELAMRPLQAHCHRGLGMLYAATGQVEQAHIALSTAIEMYRAMEMTFWLPEAEAALAQVSA